MSSVPAAESAVRAEECDALLRRRFAQQQTLVGFYINNPVVSQDEWMNALARELRRRGYATVGLLAGAAVGSARLDGADLTLELERCDVPKLSRVQLFIVSDIEGGATDFPPHSRVLACTHGCSWSRSTNFVSALRHQAYYDGFLTSCPLTESTRQRVQALWTGFMPVGVCKRPHSHFHILASGYPRSAALCRTLAELEDRRARDAILYAPMNASYQPNSDGCCLERYGKRMVRCLLDSFPQWRVLFRPFRRDLDHPQVQALLAAFAHEPRFELDADPQRAPAFSRAAVLVTDVSHIANSFAFTTLRPAVKFQPWEHGREKPVLSLQPSGFCTFTYQALIRAVREGLESPEQCRERIRLQRDQGMLPVETGLEDLAEQLDDFLHDRPRPEWISIERNNPAVAADEAGLAKIILSLPGHWYKAASAALSFSPQSLFLTAFALHMGLCHEKDQAVPGRLLASALRRLQESPQEGDPPLFRDLSPEIPRKLYGLTQLKALREKDAQLAALAEELKNLL